MCQEFGKNNEEMPCLLNLPNFSSDSGTRKSEGTWKSAFGYPICDIWHRVGWKLMSQLFLFSGHVYF